MDLYYSAEFWLDRNTGLQQYAIYCNTACSCYTDFSLFDQDITYFFTGRDYFNIRAYRQTTMHSLPEKTCDLFQVCFIDNRYIGYYLPFALGRIECHLIHHTFTS